jgi:hypothetical protein
MEKISIYKPHSIFTNVIVKIAIAKVTQIKMVGGYWEIKKPTRRATARKKMSRRFVRTVSF